MSDVVKASNAVVAVTDFYSGLVASQLAQLQQKDELIKTLGDEVRRRSEDGQKLRHALARVEEITLRLARAADTGAALLNGRWRPPNAKGREIGQELERLTAEIAIAVEEIHK